MHVLSSLPDPRHGLPALQPLLAALQPWAVLHSTPDPQRRLRSLPVLTPRAVLQSTSY